MSKFIHLVADYGKNDPAFSEVIHRFKALDPEVEVRPTAVPRFSTIATGFWIAQYSLYNPSFDELAVYANTAPRKHDEEAQEKNEGKKLVYAELDNGVPVVTVNSGHSLSFVKHRIESLHEVEVKNNGSQFRSRDYFPEATMDIIENGDRIGEEISLDKIPDVPESRVAFVDGYGNIKTTIRESDVELEPGEEVEVTINNQTVKAFYKNGTFEVPEGKLSFAAGSSGGEDSFMELFLRGGDASTKFDKPAPGDEVEIEALKK